MAARLFTLVVLGALLAITTPAGGKPKEETAPEPGWLARAQDSIAQLEYRASETSQGLQAPNRRHDLRTYFEPTGIRVVGRRDAAPLVDLRLTGVGRGDAFAAIPPGRVDAGGSRVEIARPGLREWFENRSDGLEHGFVLGARPAGEGELVFEIDVAGASAERRGRGVVLTTAQDRRLRYDGLVVYDANGSELEARLETPATDRIRIVVADAKAPYPLTVDPLLTGTADTILDTSSTGDDLGTSLDGAGDVNGDGYADLIVGAPGFDGGQVDEGAAFLFHGSAAGIADADIVAAVTQLESNEAGARFGHSVAGAGDTNGDGFDDVVVGAPIYNSPFLDTGAAFVFLGSATGVASGGPGTGTSLGGFTKLTGSEYGWSVDGAGDFNGDGYADVIVGARFHDAVQVDEGRAALYLGPSLSLHATWEPQQAGAQFGDRVAGAGDVNGDGLDDVVVGAHIYTSLVFAEGAAFVIYGGSPAGVNLSVPANATQIDCTVPDSRLGSGVAGAGDVNGDGYADVIIGAEFFDDGTFRGGGAWIFHGSAAGIPDGDQSSAQTELLPLQDFPNFGSSVAGLGDADGNGYADVIVGAPRYDGDLTDEGAVFVFTGSATGVANGNPTTAYRAIEGDQDVGPNGFTRFGAAVTGLGDIDGDGFADAGVGANHYDAGASDGGAAFLFLGGGRGISDGTTADAHATIEGSLSDFGRFGLAVASAGDVNGDGYDDIVVGEPQDDTFLPVDPGRAYVFHGGPLGIIDLDPANAATILASPQLGDQFGHSVASAGDVNGDGYGDLLVGASVYDDPEVDEGAVFLFLGSATGIASGGPATADAQFSGNQDGARLYRGASAGDLNGDGYGDIVLGAPNYSNGQFQEGVVMILLGSASGIADADPLSAHVALIESDDEQGFLHEGRSAGDVNGDGFGDLVLGAVAYGPQASGAAFVFHGSASGIASGSVSSADATLLGTEPLGFFATSVAGAGDVNGDGFGDVIIGMDPVSSPTMNDDRVFVFHGSPTGIGDRDQSLADTRIEEGASWALGIDVGGAGDVNSDGFSDVVLGSGAFGPIGNGGVLLYLGSAGGVPDGDPNTADAQITPSQSGVTLGYEVSSAGDLNGDGFADIVLGAPLWEGASVSEGGAAFVYLGGDDLARNTQPSQLRTGTGTTILPWGVVADFDVSLLASHPAGGGLVKLEVETCPSGAAFGAAACVRQVSPSWTDVTATSGVTLTETVTGLPDDLYRWRARVLHAPRGITQPGITAPANPSSGPWRRPTAQSVEADVRVLPEPGFVIGLCAGATLLLTDTRRRRDQRSRSRRNREVPT